MNRNSERNSKYFGARRGRYPRKNLRTGKTSRRPPGYGKSLFTAERNRLHEKRGTRALKNASEADNYSFGELLERWLNANRIRLKGSTESKYRYLIDRHIGPKLGKIPLSCLTSERINRFLSEKLLSGKLNGRGGLSPSYVKGMAIVIGSALRFADSEGLNVPKKITVHRPKQIKKETRVLPPDEQRRLEEAVLCELSETGVGILLALHAGLRLGEICALSWEDVDFPKKILHIRHTVSRVPCRGGRQKTALVIGPPKTVSSARDVPMTSILFGALKKMKEASASPFVVSNGEAFVSTRTFDYRYRRAMAAAGVPVVNFHALRHTFATNCIERKMDVKTLSELLGHSGADITLNTYVHSSIEMKRTQIEKLCLPPD